MHRNARKFVERLKSRFPEYFTGVSVLEIGSLNINGSCRDMFEDCHYEGVDLNEGEGVDKVGRYPFDFYAWGFDVVYSTEALEHDNSWSDTIRYMAEDCRQFMFFTCATTGRQEHGTHDHSPESSPMTNDYYRNITQEDVERALHLSHYFKEYEFEVNQQSHDLYFWGICR